MRTFQLQSHGHRIEIGYSLWTGKERVRCDGRVVSEKRSFLPLTPHSFTLQEGGSEVAYEVNVIGVGLGTGYILRRNGIVIAHKP